MFVLQQYSAINHDALGSTCNTRNRGEEHFFYKCVILALSPKNLVLIWHQLIWVSSCKENKSDASAPKMLIFLWHQQQQTQNHSRLDAMAHACVSSSIWGTEAGLWIWLYPGLYSKILDEINQSINQTNKQTSKQKTHSHPPVRTHTPLLALCKLLVPTVPLKRSR